MSIVSLVIACTIIQQQPQYVNPASVVALHAEFQKLAPERSAYIGSDRNLVAVELAFDPADRSRTTHANWLKGNKSQHVEAVESEAFVGRPYELSSRHNKSPKYFVDQLKTKGEIAHDVVAEEFVIDSEGMVRQTVDRPTSFFVADLKKLEGVKISKVCPFLDTMWVSVRLSGPTPLKEFLTGVAQASYGRVVENEDETFTLDVDVPACRELWKRSLSSVYGTDSDKYGTSLRLRMLETVTDANMYGVMWDDPRSYQYVPLKGSLNEDAKAFIKKHIEERNSDPNIILSKDWHESLNWNVTWSCQLGEFPRMYITVPSKEDATMFYVY